MTRYTTRGTVRLVLYKQGVDGFTAQSLTEGYCWVDAAGGRDLQLWPAPRCQAEVEELFVGFVSHGMDAKCIYLTKTDMDIYNSTILGRERVILQETDHE